MCLKSIYEALVKVDPTKEVSEVIVVISSISKIDLKLLNLSNNTHVLLSNSNNISENRNLIFKNAQFDNVFFTDPDCLADPNLFVEFRRNYDDPNCFAIAANVENQCHHELLGGFFRTLSQSKVLSIGSKQVWNNQSMTYTRHASTSGILYIKNRIKGQEFDIFFDRVGEDLEMNFRLSKLTRLKILAVPEVKVKHLISNSFTKFLKTLFGYGKAQGLVAIKSLFLHFNPRLTVVSLILILIAILPFEILAIAFVIISIVIALTSIRAQVHMQTALALPVVFLFFFIVYSLGILSSPMSFGWRMLNKNILKKNF